MKPIMLGAAPQKLDSQPVDGQFVTLLGESFYRIQHFDQMEPFFMSIMSSSNHWLFVASTGGLTAGRVNAEQALFPYYTVDKLTENADNTGPKTILRVQRGETLLLWEPFSIRQQGLYAVERSLYKNITGTAVVFEEVNHDLALTFRYAWRTSERFGLVRTSWLHNTGEPCQVEWLDGLQNLLPANVSSQTQTIFSALLDAYKRGELEPQSGLAIFTLSSRLTDLAEPSESLLATTTAQVGLQAAGSLLSSTQLDSFRAGQPLEPETEIRGQRCAFFVHAARAFEAGEEQSWHILADVNQDAAAVVRSRQWLRGNPAVLYRQVEEDIAAGQERLRAIVAAADGLQHTHSEILSAHHFANVLFNGMRGGVFADQYQISSAEFRAFMAMRNLPAAQAAASFFTDLPPALSIADLLARAEASGSPDLLRLASTYLPLTFSRRHGDPSRPWNRFSINIRQPDGSLRLDYEGNWRDIFQNWEALAYSYPGFTENMISTFLNATTADGYNPYRITYHGLDWEAPEPGNPWANIGYWSDHQIIYLQKLMEISASLHPGALAALLNRPLFSYANIPYRIKPYADLLRDPYNSIAFDWELAKRIQARVAEIGSDGKLTPSADGGVLRATLAEKLLSLLLAKLANFVPEGGVWMNTQRPEWNDANNALVGKGLSVVTLCYLRRYIAFARDLFAGSPVDVPLNRALHAFASRVDAILRQHHALLVGPISDPDRRVVMDSLGQAGSDYRWEIYTGGVPAETETMPAAQLTAFLDLAQEYVEHTLRANRREDALYHSYNILHLETGRAAVSHLYEMLEGQVAVLSSHMLSAGESLALLESLRASALYEPRQNSYILYPDRQLPGFLEKNRLTAEQVQGIDLLAQLAADPHQALITHDSGGAYHFHGEIRNFRDVLAVLDSLQQQPRYAALVEADRDQISALFEATFHHNQFTGRSGTFFAYEGLGSIYWHMVAKLLLAVQETALRFRADPALPQLAAHYHDIRAGLGFNKNPRQFGAFPTDPYSHTPKNQGAKQPGMTGQVKEEVLTRRVELGIHFDAGRMVFDPFLLDRAELLGTPEPFAYLDVAGTPREILVPAGALACTVCQVPVLLQAGAAPEIRVQRDDKERVIPGSVLDEATTREIFDRTGRVQHLLVTFPRDF